MQTQFNIAASVFGLNYVHQQKNQQQQPRMYRKKRKKEEATAPAPLFMIFLPVVTAASTEKNIERNKKKRGKNTIENKYKMFETDIKHTKQRNRIHNNVKMLSGPGATVL